MSLRKHLIKLGMRLEKTWSQVTLNADKIAIKGGWYITEFNVQGSVKHIPEIVVRDTSNKEFRRSLIGFHSGRNRMLFYLPSGTLTAYDKAINFDFLSRVSWLEGRARVLLICGRYLIDFFSFKLLLRIIFMQFQNRFELSTDILQFYYPKDYLHEIQRWNRLKGFGSLLAWWYRDIKVAVLLEHESQLQGLQDQLVAPDQVLFVNQVNVNQAKKIAKNIDYIIPLAKTEVLREPAIALIKRTIRKSNTRPALLYSDHDYNVARNADSLQGVMEPVLKPQPSLPYLYCYDYVGPAVVFGVDTVDITNLGQLLDDEARYHRCLRCFKHTQYVAHIPEALFTSSRNNEIKTPSANSVESAWPNILWQSRADHNILVADPKWQQKPSIDCVIPTRDGLDVLKPCVDSLLQKTDYPNMHVIVVDNGSELAETKEYLNHINQYEHVTVIDYPGEFNYSAINNTAVAQGQSDYIALINNDIEVIHSDWLTQMMVWASQPNVGIVGAKLLYGNGDIQHAGVTIGMGNAAGHIHRTEQGDSLGYQHRLVAVQNMMAVTAACLITPRTLYEQLGGLNETDFKVAYNDIDYCLRVEQMGLDIIWTPEARLFHHESVSRGDDMSEKHIERYFHELGNLQKRWKTKGFVDKYYSKHLRINDEGVYPQVYVSDTDQMHKLN